MDHTRTACCSIVRRQSDERGEEPETRDSARTNHSLHARIGICLWTDVYGRRNRGVKGYLLAGPTSKKTVVRHRHV